MSASALAANTVIRSLAGASFPLFAVQMFNKLDPRWASTLIGFIALLLAPIPLVLIRCVSWVFDFICLFFWTGVTDCVGFVQIWALFEEKVKVCAVLGPSSEESCWEKEAFNVLGFHCSGSIPISP